jgi:acyl-CoA synthetase (AMP-forming)/AMP-acid ligase II/acyl carrier protein
MPRFPTLTAMLAARARNDRPITFVDGENQQRVVGVARLERQSLALLGALEREGVRAGDALVIATADNERFVQTFWACVQGGIVAVPLAAATTDEQCRKLLRVVAQFDRVRVATDAAVLDRLDAFAAAHGSLAEARRVREAAFIAGSLDLGGAPAPVRAVRPDDLAFIQFSSGSTGEPKGVLLTHRNLCANIAAIIEAAGFDESDVALSWMPLSHDMGLVGFHLTMLAAGIAHTIMRPELFARRPLAWLDLASRSRASLLCSPNFGYQHLLRQLATKAPRDWDLSAVRLVFNGAEPISPEVCRRFMRALAPYGLAANAMFPVYGLAEASLAVTFPRPGAPLATLWVERAALGVGQKVRPAAAGRDAVELVEVGRPLPGTELRIVDDAGTLLPDETVGHLQIRGEPVSAGYLGDDADAARRQVAGGWLDTGDLGFRSGGQLLVAGRAKDLVIVNGQNLYPHDLERIAERVPGVEPQRVAAAGVRSAEADAEALALFVLHRGDLPSFADLAVELRRTLLEQAGVEVAQVVPVRRLPKTTSGKLQRYALAEAFERGEFDAEVAALAPLVAARSGAAAAAGDAGGSTMQRLQSICAGLVADPGFTAQSNLLEMNLNSLTLARIHEAIEREFPQRIDVTDLFEYPTLERLAEYLDSARA